MKYRITETRLRKMIRESVRMALMESEGSSVYMDYDSFYEEVVEELNSEVDNGLRTVTTASG